MSEISKYSNEVKRAAKDSASRNKGLSWLRQFNDFLEGVPLTVPRFFSSVFKSVENMSQEAVDMVCAWAAWRVNLWVEEARQKLVKSLHDQYGDVFAFMAPARFFVEAFRNPLSILSAVVRVVKKILKLFIGPYWILVEFIKELVEQLLRLAENLQAISEIVPPDPPNPNINFNAFKDNLKIGSIGMDIILEDPANMPSPKEKFPEPPRPFWGDYWKLVGKAATDSYKKDDVFYYYKDNTNINAGLVYEDEYRSE